MAPSQKVASYWEGILSIPLYRYWIQCRNSVGWNTRCSCEDMSVVTLNFEHISAKDTLRLLQMLLRWIMGWTSRGGGGSSSNDAPFIDLFAMDGALQSQQLRKRKAKRSTNNTALFTILSAAERIDICSTIAWCIIRGCGRATINMSFLVLGYIGHKNSTINWWWWISSMTKRLYVYALYAVPTNEYKWMLR